MIAYKDVLEGAMLHAVQSAGQKGQPINDYYVYEAVKDLAPKTYDVYSALLRLKDLGYVIDESIQGKAILRLSDIGEKYTETLTKELSEKAQIILDHLKKEPEKQSIFSHEVPLDDTEEVVRTEDSHEE
ncbi:MAG: hypothetical protein Q4Q17_03660 [Tissierellia bacterium]|nr:hypothetical protein [Tissierellia bacterium]